MQMRVFAYFVLALLVASPALALKDSKFRKEVKIYGSSLDEKFCWKSTYGRGVGLVPKNCFDKQFNAGLCYSFCKDGYHGVGPVCWKGIKSYGRGVGHVPKDCKDKQYNAGLCYPFCKQGYYGVGPVCWRSCGGDTPTDCGAACGSSAGTCAKKIFTMVKSVFEMIKKIVELVLSSGASAITRENVWAKSAEIARKFKENHLSKQAFKELMIKKAHKIRKGLNERALEIIFDNSHLSVDQILKLLGNVDPIGLVDVIRAFLFDIC